MTSRGTVILLGTSQIVCWGISYYLLGGFADLMAADLGWSRSILHGGFSAALLVMAVASPVVGRLIDRHGGRPVMATGSVLMAAGCTTIALAHDTAVYYAGWLCLGLSMRLTLYDAAFASLARIAGPAARRPISHITLFGGLASTIFWPIGDAIARQLGWRGAVLAYAGFALATLPLHLAIPRGRFAAEGGQTAKGAAAPLATGQRRLLAAGLFATIVTCGAFLNSAMSAHMIGILIGSGLATATAVWIATLRGIGQSSARLCIVLAGKDLHPITLSVVALATLTPAFFAGMIGGELLVAALCFAFFYGAGNGLTTIANGTMPLVLFDPRTYGATVGRLLVPGFLGSAAAPLVFALVIEQFGNRAALLVAAAVGGTAVAAALLLRRLFLSRSPA